MIEEIKKLQAEGTPVKNIVMALNRQGLKTPRGKPWNVHSVAYQIARQNGKAKAVAKAAHRTPRALKSGERVNLARQGKDIKLARALEIVGEILESKEMGVHTKAVVAVNLLNSFLEA